MKGIVGVVVILGIALNFSYKEFKKYENFNDGLLHIYFLNIGQGDGFLIKTPDKKLILIDGGPNETVLFRLSKILPFWVNRIELISISHFHRDHYLGAYYVKEFAQVNEILYPDQFEQNDELFILFDGFGAGEKNSQKYLNIRQDTEYRYGDNLSFKILALESDVKPISENFESLMVYLNYKDFEVLFTGDAPPSLQKAAQSQLPKGGLEVLKVPHQGSKYDLYPSFIEYLSPEVAIVSIGQNSYGHPHKEVLDYYARQSIPLYRTDSANNYIMVKTDGQGYQVDCY